MATTSGMRARLAAWLRRKRAARRNRVFNCGDQDGLRWRERAVLAADLVAIATRDSPSASVADIGCGDRKLGALLARRAPGLRYRGFDLVPQDPETERFDLRADELPSRFDAIVVLGVLEYMPDIAPALARLRAAAPSLIVSHAAADLRPLSERERRKVNWLTHLTGAEFEARLRAAHFDIIEARTTPDGRTRVWLCR